MVYFKGYVRSIRFCVSFSDEELGGVLGMALFCKSERFKQMNVGFALDEGLANPTEAVSVYYGERSAHCEYGHCCTVRDLQKGPSE